MAYGQATHGRLVNGGKGAFAALAAPLHRLRETLDLWRRRAAERDELARLLSSSPHLIADIGLTVEQAQRKIDRPLWRA